MGSAWIWGVLAGLAAGLVYAAQRVAGSSASEGAASPSAPDAPATWERVPLTDARAAAHREAAGIVAEAGRLALGRDLAPAERFYVQAVAFLESSYGRGWKGTMIGSHNWGAVQCSRPGPGCRAYEDSRADGTRYAVTFREYATPVEGAADVVRHVLQKRPSVATALQAAAPTVYAASRAMRREHYFEGFCPRATKAHGAEAARASFRSPDRDAGTRACEAEAVASHAGRVWTLVREIAQATGEPLPLREGGPEVGA